MIDKSVVIAALARDCNESLRRNIPRIEQLRSHFRQSLVVVVENDSRDGTKETLKNWETVDLIMNDFGTQTIPSGAGGSTSLHRIEKMARYRNIYMDFVRALDEQPDYLIVIDVDVENFLVEGIVKAIENAPQDWSALFANGQRFFKGAFPYFFDLYAYLPMDCNNEMSRKNDELFYESKRITKQLRKIEYLECLSAFGGLGVYKWDLIKNLNYQALPNTRSKMFEVICEHVPFNVQIAKNYVCRDMKVNYGSRSLRHLIIYSILPTRLNTSLYKIIKGRPYGD